MADQFVNASSDPTGGGVINDTAPFDITAEDNTLLQNIATEAVLAASTGAITQWYGVNLLKYAGAGSYTLAAPTAAQEGMNFVITSSNAYAHVITATTLLNNGLTGSPFTTMTFAAFAGASISLMAINQKWNVVSVNAVVLS
jgi:hypothetical protein